MGDNKMTMNYSLAPAGTTHEYNGMWRKIKGDKWYVWVDGKWIGNAAAYSGFYRPIPERDLALNRMADENDEWPCDKTIYKVVSDGFEISYGEWQDSRAKRIEVGLIKKNTDVVEIKHDQSAGLINALPEIGAEYELKPYWNKVKIEAHAKTVGGVRIIFWDQDNEKYDYSYRPHDFRTIRTDEQIAAEKRNKWAHSLCNLVGDEFPLEEAERIYDAILSGKSQNFFTSDFHRICDALLSGKLDSPKGDV